jgi:hypothetical protein
VKPEPVDLSRREQIAASSAVIVWAVGELLLRVVGNVTGVWWPLILLVGFLNLFVLGFALDLARTRKRSVLSLLLLVVPDRWWRSSR